MTTLVTVQGVSVFPLHWVQDANRHHVYLTSTPEFMAQYPNLASHLWDSLMASMQGDSWPGSVVVHVEEQQCDEIAFNVDVLMGATEDEAPGIEVLRRALEDWTMDAVAGLVEIGR